MIAIITGGSKGIGLAIARLFISKGYTVLTCARKEQHLKKAAESINMSFPNSYLYKVADLSIEKEVSAFTNWCLEIGAPDVLVNNAGYFIAGSCIKDAPGVLEKMMAANLYSAYHVTRAVAPAMIEKKSGHIFNMCSIASLNAYEAGGSYGISKFALKGFTENLRLELKDFGIKVSGIYPGAVMTDSWSGFDNSQNRIMVADDIAKMVFASTLLSPQACVEDIVIRPQLGDL